MITARHIKQGRKTDDGKLIQGYLSEINNLLIITDIKTKHSYEVNPSTIEDVAVEVVDIGKHMACPNCQSLSINIHKRNGKPFKCAYCPECGQRLKR
jgi:hypothetical protein